MTSRTTFAASERGIQRKLKQKGLGKGEGRDHQSSALMILCAAAEGAFCFLGGGEGERAKAIGREYIFRNRSFQVLAVEEGGRRVIEKS